MKKSIIAAVLCLFQLTSYAQFGTFKKKAELEKFKDTRVVVVLMKDSSYNESILAAMEKYWNFTAAEYTPDTAMKKYLKGDYAFLLFSKSKGSKNKAKLCTSEEDFNGLVITRKFKRKILADDVIARAFCNNNIDTADWETEMIRGVQLLNNYFNYAIQMPSESNIAQVRMMNDYPSDKSLLLDKKLLVEDKQMELKGKEDGPALFDGEIEEVDRTEINRAIKEQNNNINYFMYVKDEKYCNKLVINATNSEVMYFDSTSPEKCKLNGSDLKSLKKIKDTAMKKNR